MELNNTGEKYFEVTGIVAKESKLAIYFVAGNLASHLERYAHMFAHFSNYKKEKFTKEVVLKNKLPKSMFRIMVATAIVLFVIYVGHTYIEEKRLEKEQAAFAYQQTKKALLLWTDNFSRGTEKVAYLKKFEQSIRKIYNNH